MIPLKIIIHGPEDIEDKVKMMNLFKDQFSSDYVTFKSAEKNCIILLVEAKHKVLQDNALFVKEINCLIEKIFRLCKLTCKVEETTYAVVTSAEGISYVFTYHLFIFLKCLSELGVFAILF